MSQQKKLPKNIKDYLRYLWGVNPKMWKLFLFQDAVHFSRYPIAFMFVGFGIDQLIGAEPGAGIPAAAWWMAFGVFAVLALGESMHIWTAYIIRRFKPMLREYVRRDFFEYALGHSHAYYQDHFAGSIARRVTEIAEGSSRLHDTLRMNIFGATISMIAAAISMLIVSPLYSGLVALFLLSMMLPVVFRLKRIMGRAAVFSEERADVTGTIVDIFSNMNAMRNFARSGYENTVHAFVSADEKKADSKRILTLMQLENYRRFSLVAMGGTVMSALLIGWSNGIVSVGEMSAIMGQTFSLTGAVWMFGFGVIMSADEFGYIDDALKTLTPDHEVTDADNAEALKVSKGIITFDKVDFNYNEKPIFKALDFEIAQGQKVGLLGPSGAGKSTLISVLMRLFDIHGGAVKIDGQDIADVTQDSLRDSVAIIPQDTSLFHRPIIENIRYGRLDASDEEVMEATKKAHAHEFIMEMSEGYQTVVGERGIKLSGGQRQRVAIARAILKDAPILILDEATSALDSESERLIQDSLSHLMEGKTVIAVAHRLSTIAHLDRLLVMRDGAIIEDGDHKALSQQDGLYAKLWNMQSDGFIKEKKTA